MAVEMTVDDPCDDVGEIGEGLDATELACFDERGDDRPMLAASIRACEEGVLAIERDRTDVALNSV